LFLGAIFRVVKGSYDAITIRKKVKEYQQELSEDLLAAFSPYERFFATERLLMAEYMIALSKLQAKKARAGRLLALEERMNQRMKKLVQTAETELEARPATKLDLARLVNNLRELSLAVDKDLTSYRKEIAGENQKLQEQINDLGKRLEEQSGRLERQSQKLEKKSQTIAANFETLNKEFQKHKLVNKNRIGWIWVFNILALGVVLFLIFRR
jgi:methyl-accepting chemotaxis protein